MAEPSKKSPNLEGYLEMLAPEVGPTTSRKGSIKRDMCVLCARDAKVFRDPLSKREFSISGLCQKCQDDSFGGGSEGEIVEDEILGEVREFTLHKVFTKNIRELNELIDDDED